MTTTPKQENNLIKINQYITDGKGHKVAAIIEPTFCNGTQIKAELINKGSNSEKYWL